MNFIDIDLLTSADLAHLAEVKRQDEQHLADARADALADLLWDKPTIGAIRRARGHVRPPLAAGTPAMPAAYRKDRTR